MSRSDSHDDGLVAAINRTQAVVHFSPEGVILDANEIFLTTMGYELSEAVGQHHRIFMQGEAANSPEYKQFWKTLSEGSEGLHQGTVMMSYF